MPQLKIWFVIKSSYIDLYYARWYITMIYSIWLPCVYILAPDIIFHYIVIPHCIYRLYYVILNYGTSVFSMYGFALFYTIHITTYVILNLIYYHIIKETASHLSKGYLSTWRTKRWKLDSGYHLEVPLPSKWHHTIQPLFISYPIIWYAIITSCYIMFRRTTCEGHAISHCIQLSRLNVFRRHDAVQLYNTLLRYVFFGLCYAAPCNAAFYPTISIYFLNSVSWCITLHNLYKNGTIALTHRIMLH